MVSENFITLALNPALPPNIPDSILVHLSHYLHKMNMEIKKVHYNRYHNDYAVLAKNHKLMAKIALKKVTIETEQGLTEDWIFKVTKIVPV